jgi:cadmium resistance protein CadD (predicted permease)
MTEQLLAFANELRTRAREILSWIVVIVIFLFALCALVFFADLIAPSPTIVGPNF